MKLPTIMNFEKEQKFLQSRYSDWSLAELHDRYCLDPGDPDVHAAFLSTHYHRKVLHALDQTGDRVAEIWFRCDEQGQWADGSSSR